MPDRPYNPAYDTRIPYYDRTPENRALRAGLLKFSDSVGIHLICPRKGCAREGRCADRDIGAIPFCWEHHRGTLRFLLLAAGRRHGIKPGSREQESEPVMPQPFRGEPLLARLARKGVPIGKMARSVADGPEPDDWEQNPVMVEHFRRLTGSS